MPSKGDTSLFDLIQSLTKQEKIELQKHVFAGKEDNLNYKIYKLLESTEEYDEDVVIKKADIKKERLPEIKNYLYRSILKTLETIHGNNISEIKAAQEISMMNVLGYKGLFKQLQKKISAGITRYEELEDYNSVVTLKQMRDELTFRFMPTGKTAEDVDDAFADLIVSIEDLYELNYYRYLFFKSILPFSVFESKTFKLEFKQSILDKKIEAPRKPDTFFKSIILYRAQCRLAVQEKNFELADQLSTMAIKYMEQFPDKEKNIPSYFAYGFYNVRAMSCLYTADHQKCYEALLSIDTHLNTRGTPYQNNIDHAFFSVNRMSFFNLVGNFNYSIEIGNQFRKKNEQLLESFPEHNHSFNYNMGYAYFGQNDHKSALKHLNEIIQNQKENILRVDLYTRALFLEILIFFEKNDLLFCENKIRSLERFLKNKDRLDDYEKLCLSLLKACINSDKSTAFFLDQKEKFMSRLNSIPSLNYQKRYFDIECWFDSKIKNLSLGKVLQQKYEGERFKII